MPSVDLMTRFVSKSHLSAILPTIPRNEDEARLLKDLAQAVELGDSTHTLFGNRNCPIYVLYLMEKSVISLTTGWTVLMYLTVLSQFTDYQQLHEHDADVKIAASRPVEVYPLSNTELSKLSSVGEVFIRCRKHYLLDTAHKARYIEIIDNSIYTISYN